VAKQPPTKSPGGDPRPAFLEYLTVFGAFFCLALIIYWPALPGPYIWDDSAMLRAGFGSGGFQAVWTGKLVDYLPVTSTVLWAGWHIWGNNPWGFRLLNLALHAGNAALIWSILKKLKCPGGWIAAAIFCVHPVCAGTVAWIAEIKNTLSLFFALLTVFFFVRGPSFNPVKPAAASRRGCTDKLLPGVSGSAHPPLTSWWTRDFVLAATTFLLALLSKISVVTLPLVLAALEYWRAERQKTEAGSDNRGIRQVTMAVMRTSPFLLLSLVLGLVNIWFQKHHAMAAAEASHAEPLLTRLLTGGYALWFYLWKTLLPLGLMPVYPRWDINPSSLLDWAPSVLWIAVLVACWRLSRLKNPKLRTSFRALFFGFGFFSVTAVPVLGALQISYFYISPVADHFLYMPMIGVITSGTYLLATWLADPKRAKLRTTIAIAVIAVLGCGTWQRADLFGHPERLWRDNLAKNPRAAMAWTNLGDVEAAAGRLEEASADYSQCLALDPGNLAVRAIFGALLVQMGRLDEAILQYTEVIRYLPGDPNAHNNLGVALARKGLHEQARTEFSAAVNLAPNFLEARKNLGAAYYRLGRYDEAIKELQQVLQSHPHYPLAEQILSDAQRKKMGDGK
jgi:Tfp pilus assembly protein PilF